jgi:hypothetical protein
VVVHVAPTVAAQMDFWYEEECTELAHSLDRPIHVRVDPMLHPEKTRLDLIENFKENRAHSVRVGDEHEVELLQGRLPNATSAAAVVEGHIIEVENAANNAGNTARIRILDVDDKDDYVLAEMITAGVAAADKKKRRRGGRGRKVELTATEQAKQLRELAEEAARFTASRAPIGITSVTEEEEAEDQELLAERRGEKQADAIIIAEGEVQRSEGDAQHKRRRRRGRRGRGGQSGDQPQGAQPHAAQPQQQPYPPPQQNNRPPQRFASPAPPVEDADAQPRSFEHAGVNQGPEGDGQRRRRRRRGRRGRGRGGEGQPQGMPQGDRSVEPLTGGLPSSPAVPDRHIFRVGSDGRAQPTGDTAPREPSRAITPMRRAHPAVEAPPPSLTVPEIQPKKTKPARRRRTAEGGTIAGELEGTAMTALPPAKTTRVARKKAAPAEAPVTTVVADKPKRAPRKKAEAAAETSGVKKPAVRKRSTTAKTTAKKKK